MLVTRDAAYSGNEHSSIYLALRRPLNVCGYRQKQPWLTIFLQPRRCLLILVTWLLWARPQA
jgi:hypothetical protein